MATDHLYPVVRDTQETYHLYPVLNRPGFPGGSKPWKGWSHGEEANVEAVSA